MVKRIYPANVSLDGYMEDERGNFEGRSLMTRRMRSGHLHLLQKRLYIKESFN
ncbi:hypothetical protein [Paenibacillus sp. GXUN7292]|uniref:hypothetical protein n=1 Tax=Paenibacillus sp. GXUN7292 TaxID=3422499 RepID=UPI003D7DDBF3